MRRHCPGHAANLDTQEIKLHEVCLVAAMSQTTSQQQKQHENLYTLRLNDTIPNNHGPKGLQGISTTKKYNIKLRRIQLDQGWVEGAPGMGHPGRLPGQDAEWKMAISRTHILCNSMYRTSSGCQNYRDGEKRQCSPGVRNGERGGRQV